MSVSSVTHRRALCTNCANLSNHSASHCVWGAACSLSLLTFAFTDFLFLLSSLLLVLYRLMTNCMCLRFSRLTGAGATQRCVPFCWRPLPLIALGDDDDDGNNSHFNCVLWCLPIAEFVAVLWFWPQPLSKWTTMLDDEFMTLPALSCRFCFSPSCSDSSGPIGAVVR